MRKRKKNPHDPVDDAVGWLAWKKKELKDDMERYGYDPGGDADKAAAQQAAADKPITHICTAPGTTPCEVPHPYHAQMFRALCFSLLLMVALILAS